MCHIVQAAKSLSSTELGLSTEIDAELQTMLVKFGNSAIAASAIQDGSESLVEKRLYHSVRKSLLTTLIDFIQWYEFASDDSEFRLNEIDSHFVQAAFHRALSLAIHDVVWRCNLQSLISVKDQPSDGLAILLRDAPNFRITTELNRPIGRLGESTAVQVNKSPLSFKVSVLCKPGRFHNDIHHYSYDASFNEGVPLVQFFNHLSESSFKSLAQEVLAASIYHISTHVDQSTAQSLSESLRSCHPASLITEIAS
ncbi:hypothetical protein [Reinekea sp. G2M2-21]|uniref:hypothetical protein n=1 Tax=Reinekea sp. G2M2-21 TaxID=2788942 RepID=UPI0018A8EA22|nr:hypothetical protein [Reinekea sp. G2M2-21]